MILLGGFLSEMLTFIFVLPSMGLMTFLTAVPRVATQKNCSTAILCHIVILVYYDIIGSVLTFAKIFF